MNVVAGVLMLLGSVLAVLTGLGLIRFPDVLSRLQVATKLQVPGLALVLFGATLVTDSGADVALLLLVGVFQAMTVPMLGMVLGRAAYRTGEMRPELLEGDTGPGERARDTEGRS